MKANKFLTLLIVLTMMFAITSCVEDDDFKTPDVTIVDPNINPNNITTFSAVVARYNDAIADGDQVGTFEFDIEPLYIEGYVISSDQAGNFFEELIIQNKVDDENPASDLRLGLKIDINTRGLYETYQVGRKVYVKLNDLAIGKSNGVHVLGKAIGNGIEQIQEFEYMNFVVRGTELATLTPKSGPIASFGPQDINTLVQFNDVQIDRNQLSLSYAGEASDQFDGFRTIESCSDNSSILLQTSTFADFKALPVAQGRGSIQGVFSRDFGDDFNVLVVNSRADVNLNSPERCDPVFLECPGTANGATIFYQDNFESYANIGALTTAGWTNVNVSGGTTKYTLGSFSGSKYAQISGFGSGSADIEAWLVTPSINMDNTTAENLTFDIQSNFDNGKILSVLVSTNFTGDVTTADWQILDVNIPTGPSSGFGTFTTVGPVNMSCLDGTINIAFLYEGSDPSATTRYHIDNIKMRGTN